MPAPDDYVSNQANFISARQPKVDDELGVPQRDTCDANLMHG